MTYSNGLADDGEGKAPAAFRPWMSGRYTVTPGLAKLEGPAFLIDRTLPALLAEKARVLAAHPERHVAYSEFSPELERSVSRKIWMTCSAEYGRLFLAGSTLDALARQLPEDVAVIRLREDGGDSLAALHVCFPNGWAPEEKIGKSFFQTHEPVAGMETINRRAGEFARMMVESPVRLVRFVWGLRFDEALNHHPAEPERAFDPERPAVWARVERQTILPMPETRAAVFLIRTYLYPAETLQREERLALAAAVEGMSEASAVYKELAQAREAVVRYLRE